MATASKAKVAPRSIFVPSPPSLRYVINEHAEDKKKNRQVFLIFLLCKNFDYFSGEEMIQHGHQHQIALVFHLFWVDYF
jgi:hypothetical protein